MECPNEAELLEYLRAANGHRVEVKQHVAGCDSCEQLLVAFGELSASRGPAAAPPPAVDGEPVVVGEQIGRYRLDARLGRGAMGEVYLAHDPTLDRRVALKLLLESQRSALEEARVLVEARAAARVHHPNLVAVYDVEPWNGRVALAMEYVDGPTLARWLAEEPRPTDAIVRMFVDVARGLDAAHAAGLVHCDVKPDNVLIGSSGAKLGDFGLALGPDRAGIAGLRGTPRYMAPELLRGAMPSAASDQYALGVSIHEAFGGQGKPIGERPGRMPAWVFGIVNRACAREPAQRYPSVAAVANALERGRHRLRRRLALGGAVIALAAAATIGAIAPRSRGTDPCPPPRAELAGLWNPARSQAISTALGANGERATSRLAAYANAWEGAGVAACRATRVEHRYSEAMLDQRTRCLDRARSRLGALVAELTAPKAPSGDVALNAIDQLPELTACEDVTASNEHDPSLSAAGRAQLAAATGLVDKAIALVDLRRAEAALDQLRVAEQAIATVPPGPAVTAVSAEADYSKGLALVWLDRRDDALATYEHAYEEARAAANESLEVKIALELAGVLSREAATRPTATSWLGRGRAVADRLGDDALTALVAEREAGIAFASNDYPAAVRGFRTAVEIRHRRYGDADQRTAITRSSLASALGKTGAFAEARTELHAAMTGLVEARGDSHPSLVTMWSALGNIEMASGDIPAARDAFVEARRRGAAAYGETHGNVVALDINLGSVSRRLGDDEAAKAAYTRALATLDKTGKHSSATARAARQGLAQIALDHHEFAAGRELIEGLIAERLADPVQEPAALASLRIDLATALTGEHEVAKAEATLLAARDVYVKVYGEHHPRVARLDMQRAATAMIAGDNARAERIASPLADDESLAPDVRADAAWMVVNLIEKRQPARAAQLATTAEALARKAGDTKVADEAAAWIAAHRRR